MIKQKVIMTALVLSVVGLTGYAMLNNAYAVTADKYSPLVQRLAEHFNLNENEVDEVIAEVREERHQEMMSTYSEKLDEVVEEGKLTAEQKDKILAKIEEMKDEHLGFTGLTQEERRQKMEEHRAELEQWAEENGIDESYLFGYMGGFRHGMGGKGPEGFGMGMMNGQDE
ncbi:MAG: hypothetical protein UU77_C0018G0024 [candidate division WWE3 bacterium GW2011_GWC1_41_7]|uniref:DUF2680 domain-containing protein n=4 Tax=Katanobacteria TaxID=422282 RepID=A0A0G0X6S0_UNCKA|nr:MAG: hypothetical protein UU72_C0001G0097 [candidate division WWE3 bacterium GW2011_GWB1_41_6]KKS20749.1 MAG: hypothetical protein UU77_C0018G0024 [candidate division WWE3 bacterium GW2011_GWC1_41_7]KKS22852.1 MAG: hypothetical protein UU80_C0001G0017 [candidate division WWE3 bacterium GW2011_GWA1_41_8]OGC56538.1 MAG: hypothetical protein A2976_02995 [candidate division WWE3 bacterium RIFCSPLOWO2_01_FULL_41_9]